MELKQIKEKKELLEKSIANLILQFSKETEITDIRLTGCSLFEERKSTGENVLVGVNITISTKL